jgi:hypothetical protein
MLPALLLLAACPTLGPRPVVTGTVTVAADGRVSGTFQLVRRAEAPGPAEPTPSEPMAQAPAPLAPFGAEVRRARCGDAEVLDVRYVDAQPPRGPDGGLFLIGLATAWLPHPGHFHDMQVWLRLPVGWSGRLSGERPGPPVCDAQSCLQGPFRGTGQPGAMLAAAPRRLHRAAGPIEVFVAPEHEAALQPLLDTLVAQEAAFSARFGPRATRSLTVFEVETDGGFSVHGMIALASHAVARFAKGDAEAPLLAHELCHHWFGSVASGEPWLTEGLCRHCELWWVGHSQGPAAQAAFEARLAREAAVARPGLTLRATRGPQGGWRDYEAVAYSRGALVHERWRQHLGPERWDAAVRAHLKAHRAQRVEVEKFLAVTASVAPDVDVAALAAQWLDQDVDPMSGQPRPAQVTLSREVAGGVALLVFVVSAALARRWRWRGVWGLLLAGAALALWRGPGWVFGWQVALSAAAWLSAAVAARKWG